jgi:hypothetical protein
MKPLGVIEITAIAWFTSAIAIEVFGAFALFIWLNYKEVRLVFGLAGVPWYLESKYKSFRDASGDSSKVVLWLRALSLLNLALAIIFAAPVIFAI